MQNIPGLSFFDGLTRSRAGTPASGRTGTAQSPTETPLRDATPFSSLRASKSSDSMTHPLGADEGDLDPAMTLSKDSSDTLPSSSASTSAIPSASFSRRAATLSSGTTPSSPARRTSGASSTTSSRSSVLPGSSFFSSPGPLGGPTAEPTSHPRERSGSLQKESTEPTAKDVALMAQGTQAYAMLNRIQAHPIELADIIRLLVTKKAILVLPTCTSSKEEPEPSRAFFEDHVIITESNHGESLFVTLSGIRGVLKPSSSSITMIGMASGEDFSTLAADASGPTKRSFFDNISKAGSSPSTNDLKLVNSSKRPVVIFVESVGSIHALLVDNSILRPGPAPTPIVPLATGASRERFTGSTRRTNSSSSSVISSSTVEERETALLKLPKIASDLPLEWDSMVRELESFVVRIKRGTLQNPDRYANELQRKYDEVRHRFEAYGNASGLNHRWSDKDFDEVQEWVEAWLCKELYSMIFARTGSQDYLNDERLQAKISALNYLDLTLEHLGFVLDHPEDVAHIGQVVREGGIEMQKLALYKSPSDKMRVILSSHRVVIDALNREPAVQEKLEEVKSADGEKELILVPVEGKEVKSKHNVKRLSMPKILMDGVIPRLDSPLSPIGSRATPKIMMDEGYERPSQLDDDQLPESSETPVEHEDVQNLKKADDSAPETNQADEEPEKKGDEEESQDIIEKKDMPGEEKRASAVRPADIALPPSPKVEAEEPETGVLPPTRKQYSADVLLPLLIFSVVKCNPPVLISNLRYIQRFKVQDHLTGELAYCLTNMMAVVSFLEDVDMNALGLSGDIQAISEVFGVQNEAIKNGQTPLINFQEGIDHTKALGHKVSQEIVGVAEEGIKVFSDVVQDGYSKFFGRFLSANDGVGSNSGTSKAISTATTTSASSSLRDVIVKDNSKVDSARVAGGLVSDGVTSGTLMNAQLSAADQAAKDRVLEFMQSAQGPQIQFMACTNSDDLRLSDVKSLLEDYQRIGKLLEQVKKLA